MSVACHTVLQIVKYVKRYATDTLVSFIHAPYNKNRFDVFFSKKGYEIENQKTDYVISDDQRSGKLKYTARPYENEKRRSRSTSKKSKRNSSENRQKIVKSHNF